LALGFSKHVGIDSDAGAVSVDKLSRDDLQRHFAREVHDQLAQPLIALMLEIRELRVATEAPPDLSSELGRLEEMARKILRQAREMMVDLRERGELRINLQQALKNDVPVPPGRDLVLRVTSRWPKQVNGWAAFNLLRIVQQAVANAWRHGRAQKVEVLLDVGPAGDALVLVLDDGVGIEDVPYGFGMSGMQERAAILGGNLSAKPLRNGGTRIEVRFPVARLS